MEQFGDVQLRWVGHVAVVEMQRPPHNFFDVALIATLADAFEYLDGQDQCRAIVLAAQGKSFSAGANFQQGASSGLFGDDTDDNAETLYRHALRLFATGKPIVGAIHGPAVGGGLGLALVADFRVVCEQTRFAANFTRLGVHAGFGISCVLPRVIGHQQASLMLYTGRRIGGREALDIGLAEYCVEQDQVQERALALAAEIAEAAPLAVESTRSTLRRGLVEAIELQMQHEFGEQKRLARTQDHAEGKRAVAQRVTGEFKRR